MRPRQFALKASSYLWASKPAAASYPIGQPVFITDVGGFDGQNYTGSFWCSNGTLWAPVSGRFPLVHTGIPIGIPLSGSVSAGSFTIGTSYGASRDAQTGVWLYFPASAGLDSGAGWYYCTSSSGAGPFQVYTAYWNGSGYFIPYKPTSLVAASGGSGAFTQTTGADITAARFKVQGGVMSPNSALHAMGLLMYGGAAATADVIRLVLGSSVFGSNGDATTIGMKVFSAVAQNAGSNFRMWQPGQGSASASGVYYGSSSSGNINNTVSENTATDIDFSITLNLGTATNRFEMTNFSLELLP